MARIYTYLGATPMSLHPKPIPPVPEATARVARAAFPKGNIYIKIRDTLGSIYENSYKFERLARSACLRTACSRHWFSASALAFKAY